MTPTTKLQQAVALHQRGDLAEAEPLYREVLAESPDHFDALHLFGVLQTQLGRHDEAVALIRKAIQLNPRHSAAYSNLGLAFLQRREFDEALASFDRALAIRPDHAITLYNRGSALRGLRRLAEAVESYDRALALKADLGDAWIKRGDTLLELERPADAVRSYDRALQHGEADAEALFHRGNALAHLRRREDAIASYDRAVQLRPDYVEALNNRGIVLAESARNDEALASYDRALAVKPDFIQALNNRANTLQEMKRYEDAAAALARLVTLAPGHEYARGRLIECRLHCCDWTDFAQDTARFEHDVEKGARTIAPFAFLAVSDSAARQLECARIFIADKAPPSTTPLWTGERYEHDRIRLAYLSADFREHPLTHLMMELFERHDRSSFEVTAFSSGDATPSAVRARLQRAFEGFVDIREKTDAEAAGLLRTLEIDIVVDLNGFTAGGRPGVLALRPAPIQVGYLGFPGTLGASYADYILADRFVIPEAQRAHYAEKVVYLPDTFQANDSRRGPGAWNPTRHEVGLPEDGFVFCSFNTNYKITPVMFDVWMRLLLRVEGSVLWLQKGNASVEANLRREARAHGVDSDRLVFAPRIGFGEHMSRYCLADLFLDTLPFNAGTTASDALAAGLPVLTCSGNAFAARMAGSVLHAIGLPELVTHSLDEYEALAFKLATDAESLSNLRQCLARNRHSFPLFDGDRFRKHVEAAYRAMWKRCRKGEAPAHLSIEPIG